MKMFVELINESVIFRGVLAVILVTSGAYMASNGIEAPEWFNLALGASLGYFFGAPLPSQIVRRMEKGQIK